VLDAVVIADERGRAQKVHRAVRADEPSAGEHRDRECQHRERETERETSDRGMAASFTGRPVLGR